MTRLISVFGLLCLMNSFSLHAAELTASDKETLAMIAQYLRANREILNSIDLEYMRSINTYSDIEKKVSRRNPLIKVKSSPKLEFKGRFAFDGDKVLTRENTEGTDDYYHYVKNGKQLRTITQHNPRTFILGTKGNSDIRPPIPDPWAYTGHSLIYKLDKLDKRNGQVISVDSKFERGRELKVVTIEQRPKEPIVITVTYNTPQKLGA